MIATIGFLMTTASYGQTLSYKVDNNSVFTVDMPEGWKFESKPSKRDPGVMRVSGTASNGLVWFGVWVVKDAKTIDQAVSYVDSTAKSMITDAKSKKQPYMGEINGMKARYHEVTGTMRMQDGKTEKFDARVVLFETGVDRIGIAVCMADTEGLKAEKDKIDAFFKSIRPGVVGGL